MEWKSRVSNLGGGGGRKKFGEVWGLHSMSLWKAIMHGFDAFVKETRFKVGEGGKVKFWEDNWCGEGPLRTVFPHLFAIASNKEAWVQDCIDRERGLLHWNVTFFQHFNDWELESGVEFFHTLHECKISFEGNDLLVWRKDAKGLMVKSY